MNGGVFTAANLYNHGNRSRQPADFWGAIKLSGHKVETLHWVWKHRGHVLARRGHFVAHAHTHGPPLRLIFFFFFFPTANPRLIKWQRNISWRCHEITNVAGRIAALAPAHPAAAAGLIWGIRPDYFQDEETQRPQNPRPAVMLASCVRVCVCACERTSSSSSMYCLYLSSIISLCHLSCSRVCWMSWATSLCSPGFSRPMMNLENDSTSVSHVKEKTKTKQCSNGL